MNLLLFFLTYYEQLYAAGQATVEFGEWLGEQMKKLFPGGETPKGLSNAQLREKLIALAATWPGPLPKPEEIFDQILLADPEEGNDDDHS